MQAARWVRPTFRLVFAGYGLVLFGWLLLGLLPTLAQDFVAIRGVLATLADRHGALSGFASRVLDADGTMAMTPTADAWLQYGFSVLNLSLGLLLAVRRPDQRVPRLLAFALLGTAATFNDPSHRAFHITGSPWPIALAHFTFHVTSGVTYLWAVVLFPDGELPRRIRLPRSWLRLVVAAVTLAAATVCWLSSFLAHPQFFVVFFGIAIPLAGVGSQVLRLRDPQTDPADRAPARLLCAALIPALATALLWSTARVIDSLASGPAAGDIASRVQALFPIVFAVVPVVLCAAIVRYRLWEIDRLLSRVLAYGVIAIAVGCVYVLAVVTGGWLVGGELWWTVLGLAVAAALVEPLRIRAGRWANRVVYGQVLSPDEALAELTGGLEQLSAAGGLDQVAAVTVEATRASAATLWLLDDHRLVRTTGPTVELLQELLLPGPEVPSPPEAAQLLSVSQCWAISHQGVPLGFLAVDVPAGTNLTETDRSLIRDVAGHAGLLVHNALLGVRLSRQIAELLRSSERLRWTRRRLVETRDAERRALERDLHDGSQQALVAAIIGIRTARRLSEQGQSIRGDLLELLRVLQVGAQMLDELISAGRPAALTERGLAGALLEAGRLVGRSGLQVTVTAGYLDRGADPQLWAAAETAVYFCCAEALQNAVKYAKASAVTVEVATSPGGVRFEVVDDGKGFDQAGDAAGGLSRLADRCVLLGGSLEIVSAVGVGTTVRGRIPLPVRLPSQTGAVARETAATSAVAAG